jgi:hypothetical protein
MRTDGEWTWIDVKGPFRDSGHSVLVETRKGDLWIPKSQIGAKKKDPNDPQRWIRIEVRRWLAKKEGLVEDDSLRKAELEWQTGRKPSTGEWVAQDDPKSDPKDLL